MDTLNELADVKEVLSKVEHEKDKLKKQNRVLLQLLNTHVKGQARNEVWRELEATLDLEDLRKSLSGRDSTHESEPVLKKKKSCQSHAS